MIYFDFFFFSSLCLIAFALAEALNLGTNVSNFQPSKENPEEVKFVFIQFFLFLVVVDNKMKDLIFVFFIFCFQQQQKNAETTSVEQSSHKSKIQAFINRFHEIEKQINDTIVTNMVFILGDTNADKATFVKFVTDNNTNLISKPVEFMSYNELVFIVETNTTIHICPRYHYHEGPEYDIIYENYLMKKIADHAKAMKFIFVIPYDLFDTTYVDGLIPEPFLSFARYATNIIKNITKFQDGIAIVVSKVNDNHSDEQCIENIVSFLEIVKSELIQHKEELLVVPFIEALLMKNGTDKIYPKIGLMREPKILLNDTIKMQNQTLSLKNLLYKSTKYIEHDAVDIRYTIPPKAKLYIIVLEAEIDEDILSNILNVTNTLEEYYQNLVQSMLDKIQSLDNGTTIINDIDISEAQKFAIELISTGPDNLSTLIKEINEHVTTSEELSARINNTVALLNINVSQESLSNIFALGKDYEFLENIRAGYSGHSEFYLWTFHNVNWKLYELKIKLNKNADDMITKINNIIKSNIVNSVKKIKEYFSHEEETVDDIAKLFENIVSGDNKLSETEKAITDFEKGFDCIQKMRDDFYSLNNSDANIISATNILSNTTKYGKYLQFLRPLSYIPTRSDSFKCDSGELRNVLTYLEASRNWYLFLIYLDDELSRLSPQTNELATCQNLARNIIYSEENKKIVDIKLIPFLTECYRHVYNIDNIKLDKFKLVNLKKIIHSSLNM